MSDEPTALRLYRAHRATLVAYAGRLSGDRAGAEDIVHDAWLLMDRRGDDGTIREPLGYLRRIIRNLVLDRARRTRETTPDVGPVPEIADDRPSAEAGLMARQAMERVLDTLDALPVRQQTAIRMYHFEGLKLREVAARLGLSVSHTQSLIAEGMERCDLSRREGL